MENPRRGETLNQESGGRDGNQEKRYYNRTSRQQRFEHNVGTCHDLRMCRSNIPLDRNLPPCSWTMVNATNVNKVTRQRYRQPTCQQRMPRTLATIAHSLLVDLIWFNSMKRHVASGGWGARGLQPQLHPKAEKHPQAYHPTTKPWASNPPSPPCVPGQRDLLVEKPGATKGARGLPRAQAWGTQP